MANVLISSWISDGWIYSREPSQDGRFWIHDNWIWGPQGAEVPTTGYWIQDGWILGPVGAEDPVTGFFIRGDWIYGPRVILPFVQAQDDVAGPPSR